MKGVFSVSCARLRIWRLKINKVYQCVYMSVYISLSIYIYMCRFFYLFRCLLSSMLPLRSVGRSNEVMVCADKI